MAPATAFTVVSSGSAVGGDWRRLAKAAAVAAALQTLAGNTLYRSAMNDSALAGAVATFQRFVAALVRDARVVIFHDFDADGVTAGVVLQLALQRACFSDVVRLAPGRERDAWSETNLEALRASGAAALFLLDLGTRDEPLLPGVRTCIIDHHHPDGVPPGATLITAYEWDPIPNTSLLTYELASTIAPINDLDWIAAVGVLSDLGERAPFPILATVKERHRMSHLKEVTALVNASRRASVCDPESAARALLRHATAQELLASEDEDVVRLRAAREEVKLAMNEAKKAAPKFAGNVALIRTSSRCQVHPLIAQIWRTRLPKYIVIAANDGYVDGRVHFSVRSAAGINLIDFLRAIDLGEGEGSFGHGHDQATGGSLPLERWNLLLEKLGFS